MNKLFTSLGMEGERHKGADVRAQNGKPDLSPKMKIMR
jgi:hypothetical protein